MKDHQAPRFRPLTSGIQADEFYNTRMAKTGTTWDQVHGYIPVDPGLALEGQGVPVLASGEYSAPVRFCLGITKKGTECKARPVSGRDLCAGHQKQLEAESDPF